MAHTGVRLCAAAVEDIPHKGHVFDESVLRRSMGTGEGSKFTGELDKRISKEAATVAEVGVRERWTKWEAKACVVLLLQTEEFGSPKHSRAAVRLGGIGSTITKPAKA